MRCLLNVFTGSRPAHWLPPGLAVPVALACTVGLTVAMGGAAAQAGPAAAPACSPAWVTAWEAATLPAPADPSLEGATLRMVARPQVGGSEVRVRLSNAFGETPLQAAAVTAAGPDDRTRPVRFAGRDEVTIAPGSDVLSDPVPLAVEAGHPLVVGMHLPVVPDVLTQHAVALQTSYVSRAGGTTPVDSWLVLTGVDVLAARPVNAVVAVGDSITDGVGSDPDADQRWTDALSARLASRGGAAAMAVLNAGISGNRLLGDEAPLRRFDRDVAAAAGVSDVVLHIGTNDIATGRGAVEIVAGMQGFAERARAAGKRVFLTTVTPSDAGLHGTPSAVAVREAVNAWVLRHGNEHADGVFDFAAAVADPARPTHLLPEYDSGDGLHLSPAGYRALAAAVEPARLSGSACLADTAPVRVRLTNG
ncbi:GDSL-type esterase/lipase family protein [Pseudonocardia aurantiaca]|uniref:GDSL-type esterase/lipase family protein n=1 Tax=Pseudonocardia aurantiaca TaxID=75290 RepID=A0ABW4FMM9_9PSEU